MANLCDLIEEYLKDRLRTRKNGVLELQRGELAERFRCVPSQINYVLQTRFTPERGYQVESRRGGGGYVRLIRLNLSGVEDSRRWLLSRIGDAVSQEEARGYIMKLFEEEMITEREAAMLQAAVRRETLRIDLPARDRVRASLLKGMLLAILRY